MVRLFADENFPLPAVEALRRLGYDVLTLQDAGQAGQALPDEAVLALADDGKRSVLTLNRRHFIRLHDAHPDHEGIIVCTFDPDFTGQADRIHQQIEELAGLSGRLIRINRPASRPA